MGIDDLVAANAAFAEGYEASGAPSPPARRVAVVTCMDARVDPARLLGLAEGDAHVIRNAGGAVTEDVVRSLVVSQRLLGTTEVVLIHHTGCGMLSFSDDAVKAEIERDTGLRPPFALEAFADLDADVRQSVARVRTNPYLPHTDAVRGFVYDITSGRLREVT